MDFWTSGAWKEWAVIGGGIGLYALFIAHLPGWILDVATRRAARRRIGESMDPVRTVPLRRHDVPPEQHPASRGRAVVTPLRGLRPRIERRRSETRVIWHE